MTTNSPNDGRVRDPALETEPIAMLGEDPQDITNGSENDGDGPRRPHPSHGIALLLPVVVFLGGIVLWASLHHLLDWGAWQGERPLPTFDFVTPGPLGRVIEMMFAINLAVQLRWIFNSIETPGTRPLDLRRFLAMWLFTWWFTTFVTGILLILLQNVTITFAGDFHLSLAEADAPLYGAIAALLGMSVRRTHSLLRGISDGLFERFASSNSVQ